jgi:serine protease SohB
MKSSTKERLIVRKLNDKFAAMNDTLLSATMPAKAYKKHLQEQKRHDKLNKHNARNNIFVIDFQGDMQASALSSLREIITAILNVARPQDAVVVKLNSGGGIVHCYGLAAAQLQRLRSQQLHLTIIIDKVAASGGYLMACVANKIIAAPFAIVGSIGVLLQMPNFKRFLAEKNIDFEQITAGNYKRTLTLFGNNTAAGRDKVREELNAIHHQFQQLISEFRPNIDLSKIATGEYWLAKDALKLQLVDALGTSDDYLLKMSKKANIFELSYTIKTPLSAKIKFAAQSWVGKLLLPSAPWLE